MIDRTFVTHHARKELEAYLLPLGLQLEYSVIAEAIDV